MLATVLPWVALAFALALALAGLRLLRGPTRADRILALDTLYVNALALLVVIGLWQRHALFFELALLIGLLGFIGTVMLARFVLQTKGPRS